MGASIDHFREIVNNMKVIECQQYDIVFDLEEDLHIVINGRVVLRFHDHDPLNYSKKAQYTAGMVLGHPHLDNGLSSQG